MFWFQFKTKYGYIKVEYSGKNLLTIDLNAGFQKRDKYYKVYKGLKDDLSEYFSGGKTDFNKYKIIQDNLTEFEKKVLDKIKLIPYGNTRSYSQIAKDTGHPKACRAVGNALNRNPVPIVIPCHRVIKNNEELGGYSAGIKWKKILLGLEKYIKIRNID
ncbi:MAG: methylated-DNA--[protein]-cysteine S-methyltransferase [bacterium]|nr:methylated-DNA--[protein]-cysteine S-methyltransferase [bacterium]